MLDPSSQFCHNPACPARGKVGEGNIGVHSQEGCRYVCNSCDKTFAATRGTPLYRLHKRLHKAADLTVIVMMLLCHGCPVQAIVAAFGRVGRPRLVLEEGLMLAQVVKQYAQRRVVSVTRKAVRGTQGAIIGVLAATGGGKDINTAYIERLNATFRAALVVLVRRGRAIAHKEALLNAGMYLVGCAYNFVWLHESLRLAAPEGSSRKWRERTPAMAAGLTDHPWTMAELLSYQVPLPAWVPPKRRGRPPKQPPELLSVGPMPKARPTRLLAAAVVA